MIAYGSAQNTLPSMRSDAQTGRQMEIGVIFSTRETGIAIPIRFECTMVQGTGTLH